MGLAAVAVAGTGAMPVALVALVRRFRPCCRSTPVSRCPSRWAPAAHVASSAPTPAVDRGVLVWQPAALAGMPGHPAPAVVVAAAAEAPRSSVPAAQPCKPAAAAAAAAQAGQGNRASPATQRQVRRPTWRRAELGWPARWASKTPSPRHPMAAAAVAAAVASRRARLASTALTAVLGPSTPPAAARVAPAWAVGLSCCPCLLMVVRRAGRRRARPRPA